MLIIIFLVCAFVVFKVNQENNKRINIDTSKVPIFSGAIIGFLLGPLLGYLLSKYILPVDLAINSDIGRDLEFTFLGSFFGLICGVIGAVIYFGWKENKRNNSKKNV